MTRAALIAKHYAVTTDEGAIVDAYFELQEVTGDADAFLAKNNLPSLDQRLDTIRKPNPIEAARSRDILVKKTGMFFAAQWANGDRRLFTRVDNVHVSVVTGETYYDEVNETHELDTRYVRSFATADEASQYARELCAQLALEQGYDNSRNYGF